MSFRTCVVFLLVTSASWTACFGQSVEERQGNIWFIATDGSRQQLTSLGLDSQPSLSFGGRWVVYVRKTPDLKISAPISEVDDCCTINNEMWIADTKQRTPPRRVLRASNNNHRLIGFGSPKFSVDGNLIFFGTNAAADASAFYSLNLTTGFIRYLFHGIECS